MDNRKLYLSGLVAGAVASQADREAFAQDLAANDRSGALKAFVETSDAEVLAADVSGTGSGRPQACWSASADCPPNCDYQLVFTKLRPGPLADDVAGQVAMATVHASPAQSLYHALRTVYAPLLGDLTGGVAGKAAGNAAGGLNPKLQELLAQLQAGLGAEMGRAALGASEGLQNAAALDAASLPTILEPADELDFWARLAAEPGLQSRTAQQVGGCRQWALVNLTQDCAMCNATPVRMLHSNMDCARRAYAGSL